MEQIINQKDKDGRPIGFWDSCRHGYRYKGYFDSEGLFITGYVKNIRYNTTFTHGLYFRNKTYWGYHERLNFHDPNETGLSLLFF